MAEGRSLSDEELSALVDGELSADEAEAIIEQVTADPELRRRWTRYHAERAALSGGGVIRLSPDFAERCSERLAQEPPVVCGSVRRWFHRAERFLPSRQAVGGFATAAGVGAVALAGFMVLQPGGGTQEGQAPLADGGASADLANEWRLDERSRLAAPGLRPDGLPRMAAVSGEGGEMLVNPFVQQRLDDYVTNHAVFSGGAEMPGVIRSGRLAGHRPDR